MKTVPVLIELLNLFICVLLGGRNQTSESAKRRATSESEDALFIVHNGQFLPQKTHYTW